METSGNWFESLLQSLRAAGQTDDKRRAIRVGVRFAARMVVFGEGRQAPAVQVWARDVSQKGIGFTCERALAVGQKIAIWIPQVKDDPLLIVAEVRNCRPLTDCQFAIGALFLSVGEAPRRPLSAPPPVAATPTPAPADDQMAAIRRAMFG